MKIALLLMLLVVSSAFGTPIIAGTGLTAPSRTITFSEIPLANNTALTNQYASLGLADLSGFYYNGCLNCTTTPPSGAKPDIGNFAASNTAVYNTSVVILFTTPVSDAAFQTAFNGGTISAKAFLGSTQIDSLNSSPTWGWYGFTGETFDRITINAGEAMLVDNLEFNPVPEPATLALTGLGLLLSLGVLRRR